MSEKQKLEIDNAGRRYEIVNKREIWELIKNDEFLAEMAKAFAPTKILHGNKLWRKQQ